MAMMNVWNEAGILPMAIRLRKSGRCPAEIDNLYGQVIVEIVLLATRKLPEEDCRYAMHLNEFLQADVQANMVLNALNAAEKYVDSRKDPRSIVNYLVKAVQNRLRNLVRDTEARKRKMEIVQERDLKFDMMISATQACNLEGATIWRENPNGSKETANDIY